MLKSEELNRMIWSRSLFHISDSANLLRKCPGYSRHVSSLAQMPLVSEHHGAKDIIGKRRKIPCADTTEHSSRAL